jgi:fatty-acyl-CoA synthase
MQAPALTYHDWIANHALRRANAPAAIDLASGRRFTYGRFHARIDGIAAYLADDLGIGAGERVAVLAVGSTDVFEIQFACARVGAIFVPLNWRLAAPELVAILEDCGPALLIHDAELAARATDLTGPGASWRLLQSGEVSAYEQAATSGRSPSRTARMLLQDTGTLLYTSGTTGQPKGVMVTHAMNLFNAINLNVAARISERSVYLAVLPLFHTGGLNVYSNPVFHAGGTVIVMASFDPGETLRALGDPTLGVTHYFGVPAHYQFPAQHPDFATTDLSRIEVAGVGGAPTPLPVLEAWQAHGVALTQGYGMTETGPVVLYLDQEDCVRKAGCAGKPPIHVDVRLVGTDGRDVADGEVGEIWVRGPSITPGYWRNAQATEAAFIDGWLRSGDAATRDADGYYTIVDRWKDMYISGGENVYPAEVENVLYQLPEVAEAAVIGVASARWGETGLAIMVLKPGKALTESEVIAHCRRQLAHYKVPQSVAFTNALPRNATGKVHKPTLRQMFASAAAA